MDGSDNRSHARAPRIDDLARICRALNEAVLADRASQDVAPEDVRNFTVVRIADEIVVDLMGKACGVTYADAIADADTFEIGGVDVPVASKRTLIRTKDTVRPSDRADREYLQIRLDEENRTL